MPPQTVKRYLAVFCVVALILRIGLVLVHPVIDLADSHDYDMLAKQILHNQPYMVTLPWGQQAYAARMPGYPIFIAGIYAVAGARPLAVLLIQALLSAACVPLVYLLGRRISITAGLMAAAFTALDPLGILFCASLLSETCFTLALLGMVILIFKIAEDKLWLYVALLAGLCGGSAIYLRPAVLWLVLIFPLIFVRQFPRRAIVSAGLILGCVILMLIPWLSRNNALVGTSWTHLTTLEGICLYDSVSPQATGAPMEDKVTIPPNMVPLDEAQRDAQWSRLGWQYIREDPARMVRLAFIKFGRTWSPWLNAMEYQIPIVNILLTLWHVPIYILALIGLFCLRRRVVKPLPMWNYAAIFLPIIYFSLLHSLFFGSVRYRVPLMPLVYVFAAAGLVTLLTKFFPTKISPTSIPPHSL